MDDETTSSHTERRIDKKSRFSICACVTATDDQPRWPLVTAPNSSYSHLDSIDRTALVLRWGYVMILQSAQPFPNERPHRYAANTAGHFARRS
jgi:hypothetical protein